MIIIDPVALGDTAFSRASTGTYYDKTGVLQTAIANALRVCYDPANLSAAPFVIAEGAATNLLRYSQQFAGGWGTDPNSGTSNDNVALAPDGTMTASNILKASINGYRYQQLVVPDGVYTFSVFVSKISDVPYVMIGFTSLSRVGFNLTTKQFSTAPATVPVVCKIVQDTATFTRISVSAYMAAGITVNVVGLSDMGGYLTSPDYRVGDGHLFWGAQFEAGPVATSYTPTTAAAVTRSADIVGTAAGLIYSNVAITELTYGGGTTFALNDIVIDPATHLTYQSLVASNVGNALTNAAKWAPLGATNRWAMFDQYNNTQTSNAEEIVIVVSPLAISQGLYLGNVDASEIRISVVDLVEGLVHSEVQSLVVPNSGSSYFNWCFKRIQKKSYAVSVQLPVYANALVTIAVKKPGGTAKCGVCALGVLVDVGLSQYGLGTEIKDYSTTLFNFDGTSSTVVRGYSKRLTVDVVLDNSQIDTVIEALTNYRQKPVAWVGASMYGAACAFGRYSSFKNIIELPTQSKMALQIEGTV